MNFYEFILAMSVWQWFGLFALVMGLAVALGSVIHCTASAAAKGGRDDHWAALSRKFGDEIHGLLRSDSLDESERESCRLALACWAAAEMGDPAARTRAVEELHDAGILGLIFIPDCE